MKYPLQELKAIAHVFGPNCVEAIDKWIEGAVGQVSWKVLIHYPEKKDMQDYRIKQAMQEMGTYLADNSNMFPIWEKVKHGHELRISTLYFKNEFGK